ncbi:MAG: hypothetical protein EXR62_08700 [Chloroflexi bacterium]|nr:hypothetical protein [Chloroflexota bacterium]
MNNRSKWTLRLYDREGQLYLTWHLTSPFIQAIFFVGAALLALLLYTAQAYWVRYDAMSKELVQLHQEKQQQTERLVQLSRQISTMQQEHDRLDQLLQESEGNLANVVQQIDQEQHDIQNQADMLKTQVWQEVADYKARVRAEMFYFKTGFTQLDQLTEQVRGMVGLPAIPLTSGNPENLVNNNQPVNAVGPTDLKSEGTSVGTNPDQMNGFESIAQMNNLVKPKLAELQKLRDQVAQHLARVEPQVRKDPVTLEKELRMQKDAPKVWPVQGEITSYFGYRSLDGQQDFHTGLDIGAKYGTVIVATKMGTVIFAGWKAGYGWAVELDHGNGYTTLYSHMLRYVAQVGEVLKEGDPLGLVGSSGHSTGPHVHYEVRYNQTPLDPLQFLVQSTP